MHHLRENGETRKGKRNEERKKKKREKVSGLLWKMEGIFISRLVPRTTFQLDEERKKTIKKNFGSIR